jgi:uncharacterized membrane protein YhhN
VLLLLVGAALALTPESSGQRAWFVAALAASLVGDVALLAPPRWFVAGLAAFLVAHLAYVAGILLEPGPGESALFGLLLAGICGAALGVPIIRGALQRRGAVLAAAATAYLLAISATVVAAGASGEPVARIGAVALYASDGILGWNRFVRPLPQGRLLTRVPYHAGQALMVLSLIA